MYNFDLIYVQAWSRPYIRSFDLIYVQVDLIYLTLDLIYQILTIYLKTDFCPIWRVILNSLWAQTSIGCSIQYEQYTNTKQALTVIQRDNKSRLTHEFKS